jgi:hypothetical protein
MAFIPAFAFVAVTACGGGGSGDAPPASGTTAWRLVLEVEGATHELPLERMDIFLTEDEWPEIFEIHGDGVTLVGEFPAGVRVDYDEAFENLIDQPIAIRPRGGDPRDEKDSQVELDGIGASVSAGTFTVERTSGSIAGADGDKTLHGTIELRVHDGNGERTIRGRFATHAVTWG